MKKFFTLIAMALMTMGVNAQTWNFSEWAEATYEEATVVNGLKINAESGKAITIDANSKTVDGVEYTKRLKLGGSGSATSRNIGFTASAAGTLKIIATSSSSGADRSLEIALDGTAIGTIPAKGGVVEAGTVTITAAGEVTIYSPSSGVNMYLVEFSAAGSGPEVWDASTLDLTTITSSENKGDHLKSVPEQYPGAAPDADQITADATAPLSLTDYTFTVSTPSITFTGISTPNTGDEAEAWRFTGKDNQRLDKDELPVKFGKPLQAKSGNPALNHIEYYYTNTDKNRSFQFLDSYWTPDCGQLPKKGEYYEVTTTQDGTFTAGIFMNRAYRYLYVVDKATTLPLAPSAITFNGYNNNNTVVLEGTDAAYTTFKINDDYTVSHSNPAVTLQDKEVFGFISFAVEAGKSYLLFSSNSQLGIYGFQFTPGGTDGIETVKTQKAFSADAPMYNMAGQKVDKSYKGIVIQNGRKFYNK